MFVNAMIVGAGGFIGAACRYLFGVIMGPAAVVGAFPLSTFLINLIGSCLIGFFSVVFPTIFTNATRPLLFVSTGMIGGFTTLSSFGLETIGMLETGEYGQAGIYVAVTIVLCFAGVAAGRALGRVAFPVAPTTL